jgi:hypothetical protein
MIYSAILLVMSIVMIVIGRRSDMLRNGIFNLANFRQLAISTGIKNPRPSFSLGRTQLAFWTVIVVSSFIYVVIAQSTGGITVPYIDPVNLVLLGIAGSTTAVAKVIDNSQQDDQGSGIPQQDYPSSGFFTDLISDDKGVSIHRLQNVIWTLVVGGIYIIAVFENHKTLPGKAVITPELLGLMGISAGAYLSLKTTENSTAPDTSGVNAGSPVAKKGVL